MHKYIFIIGVIFIPHLSFGQNISLDSTFGFNGKVNFDFKVAQSFGRDVLLQTDGKIIIGGYALTNNNSDFAVTRLLKKGSIDSTFATNGYGLSNSQFDGNDYGFSLTRLSDTSFVLTGASETRPNRTSSGTALYDTSGVQQKFANYNVGPLADSTFKSVVLPNGNILIGGWDGLNVDFCLLGILPNLFGPDLTFGSEARACISDSEMSRMYDLALQSDSKILAVGESKFAGNKDFIITRFNTDGSLDSSFAVHGIFRQDFNSNKESALVVLPTSGNKILVAGTGSFEDSLGFNMIRLTSLGQLDSTFGNNGLTKQGFVPYAGGKSIIQQVDGKILAVGSLSNGLDEDFTIARFNSNGAIDSTFGQNGILFTDFGGTDDRAFSVAYDSLTQSIVVVGESLTDTSSVFAIAKYSLDTQVGIEEFPSLIRDVKVYPNPSTSESQLYFSLKSPEYISIKIIDIQGRLVKQIASHQFFQAGDHTLDLTFKDLAPGTYNLQLRNRNAILQTIRFIKTP